MCDEIEEIERLFGSDPPGWQPFLHRIESAHAGKRFTPFAFD
jgi:hypothetical protein